MMKRHLQPVAPKRINHGVRPQNLQKQLLILLVLAWSPTPTQSYHESLGMSEKCKDRCDKDRASAYADAYTLDCNKVTSDPTEQTNCKNDCQHCPTSICDTSQPNIFKCPETHYGYSDCGQECSDNKPDNLFQALTFKCTDVYDDQDDVTHCQNICLDNLDDKPDRNCPRWICDKNKDPNTYHCSPSLYGICATACDKHRKRKFGSSYKESFQFSCNELKGSQKTDCEDVCYAHCSTEAVCDYNYDYNNDKPFHDSFYYFCPSTAGVPHELTTTTSTTTTTTTTTKPTTTTTTTTTTTLPPITQPPYEGSKCEKRCDKFRLGGDGKYELLCDQLFSADSAYEDLTSCQRDCESCPDDICEPVNSIYNRFRCPGKEGVSDAVADESKDKATVALIVSIIFAVLMTIFFIVMTVLFCKSKTRLAEVMPVQEEQVQPIQQQQQQQPFQQQQQPYQQQQMPSFGQGSNPGFLSYPRTNWPPPPPPPQN